jgi:hypothetical protein
MKQSILTKFIPATNTKPRRVKATTSNKKHSTTLSHALVDDGRFDTEAHAYAARLLAYKLGWVGTMVQGYSLEGCVFVFVDGPKIELGAAWL